MTTKSIAIKAHERKFSRYAEKVVELTVGDLRRVAKATEWTERSVDRGVEVSSGHSRRHHQASAE
ncbi:MAG: hypothetical protein KC777_24475 [Cyanobacteria bacterium HKST-UBA02]|nr:hypothetical protein [Cyanobacteria bacterium HKST-UBA02]